MAKPKGEERFESRNRSAIKVEPGDTVSKIAKKNQIPEEDLRRVNPGVSTLSTGQVINLPKTLTGGMTPAPVQTPSTFTVPKPVTQTASTILTNTTPYTGTAGYWGAYNQPNVQAGGMLSPDKNPVLRQQPYLGSSGYLNPAYQTPQNTQPTNVPTSTVKLTSPRPAGFFTGDPNDPNTAAWRAYWNNVAQLGGDPNIPAAAPTVMTREEIWQMKAASRRKKMRGMSADEIAPSGGSGGYEPFQYSEQTQSYVPETLVRSITWGI